MIWRAGLARADRLEDQGAAGEARNLRAGVRAAVDRVAAGLPDDLRALFEAGPLLRRARRN